MADKEVSSLPAATGITDEDLFLLQQGDTAKKLTGAILRQYAHDIESAGIDSQFHLILTLKGGETIDAGTLPTGFRAGAMAFNGTTLVLTAQSEGGNVMVRGDAYNIEIEIRNGDAALTEDDVELVEITIHDLVKTYPGDVAFANGKFLFPISQQETFKLPYSCLAQIRVKFPGGDVIGSEIQSIDVRNVLSQAVL